MAAGAVPTNIASTVDVFEGAFGRFSPAVDESIAEADVRLSLSTTGFQHRASVTGGLVDVLVSPSQRGQMYGPTGAHAAATWTLDHDQVAIEALLENETGAGDMRTVRDHDDCAPAVSSCKAV